MIIVFRQTGGIMGIRRECRIDTAELAPADSHTLEDLVKRCGENSSKKHLSNGKDVFQYSIVVSESNQLTLKDSDKIASSCGENYELCFDDITLPNNCRALVQFLQNHAQPK